jgi:hypothetical protein
VLAEWVLLMIEHESTTWHPVFKAVKMPTGGEARRFLLSVKTA